MRKALLLVVIILFAGQIQAEKRYSIDDLSFMTGRWTGEGFNGQMEEIWSQPYGLTMVATFRLVMKDTAKVLEYIVVEETDTDLILRFKHYNRMMVPWEEEPLTYYVTDLGASRVVFSMRESIKNVPKELVYDKSGDTLDVLIIGSPEEDGTVDTIPLIFTKTEY